MACELLVSGPWKADVFFFKCPLCFAAPLRRVDKLVFKLYNFIQGFLLQEVSHQVVLEVVGFERDRCIIRNCKLAKHTCARHVNWLIQQVLEIAHVFNLVATQSYRVEGCLCGV